MNEWQPIETAPRDGTIFLAFCPDQPPFYRGKWHDQPESPQGVVLMLWDSHAYLKNDYSDEGVAGWAVPDYDRRWVPPGQLNPTHWMPLPETP